ncbi:hypothetical protein FQR65_LT16637 [Abscondita terminalis]|nr:hypothetical protein FQR65_LT16637 [Abscondita terminalis]
MSSGEFILEEGRHTLTLGPDGNTIIPLHPTIPIMNFFNQTIPSENDASESVNYEIVEKDMNNDEECELEDTTTNLLSKCVVILKKKDNVGGKGSGESPVHFDYFVEFSEIFGTKPNVVPIALAASSSNSEDAEGKNPKDKTRPSRLQKEVSTLTKVLTDRDEKREEARERRHAERQAMSQEALKVYQDMIGKLIGKL